MSNPTVINVTPAPGATDIVLGSSIVITFSKAIDTDSFNNATFVLVGPNFSSIVTPDNLVEQPPSSAQGQGYILGNYAFSTKTYPQWAPATIYHIGDQVIDSNGNAQTATETGKSAPYAPAWLTTPGDSTVDNNVPQWQARQFFSFGQFILDSNANLQKCSTSIGGTTGAQVPSWNITMGGITFDGSISWQNVAIFDPVLWINNGIANSGGTVVTFTPSKGFIAGTQYTALIVGEDSPLATQYVHDLSGNNLVNSQQWVFTTGTLNIVTPPIQNPILPPKTFIKADQIQVIPRPPVGVDDPSVASIQTIELIFPAPVDPNSFDPSLLLIGVNPIMNDPDVMVPGAAATYIIQGNKIIVTISGV